MASWYKYFSFSATLNVIYNLYLVSSLLHSEEQLDESSDPIHGRSQELITRRSTTTTTKNTYWTPYFAHDYTNENGSFTHDLPRDYNIILYAVQLSEVKKKGSVFEYVYHLFRDVCGVTELTRSDIVSIKFLTKNRNIPAEDQKKIPILITLRTVELKSKLLHRRRLLSVPKVKMEHHLPPEVYEAQNKVLKPLMKQHRDLGAYAIIRNGKLIVNGLIVTSIDVPKQFTYDSMSDENYLFKVEKTLQKIRNSLMTTAAMSSKTSSTPGTKKRAILPSMSYDDF